MDLFYSSLTKMELYFPESPSLNSLMLAWATINILIDIWKVGVEPQPYSFTRGDMLNQALHIITYLLAHLVGFGHVPTPTPARSSFSISDF